MTTWTTGNAAEDTRDTRGWLVGHFVHPSKGVRRSGDIEVKWGVHAAGENANSGRRTIGARHW